MPRLLRIVAPALAALAVLAGAWAALRPTRNSDKPTDLDEADIDAIVTRSQHAWNVPGVAVAVVRDDRVIYLKGFGKRAVDEKEQVTPDTLFPIASCTKAFTTTAMAMLVSEGKLGWDDPVRKHVPNFHLADPLADSQVTLRDLVSHRTGVGSNDYLWYRSPWDREEVVRRIGLVKPKYPFRGGFEYQSTMFTVAGMAVESASGEKWEDFVRERICTPLSMNAIAFTTAEAKKSGNLASPHRADGAGKASVIPGYAFARPEPSGSIHASARDLAQWLRFHLGDGTFEGKRLVSAAALAETHSPQNTIPYDSVKASHPETTEMRYGMAWVLQDYRGEQLVSHAGQVDGYRVHLAMLPSRHLGIAILNNLDRTQMNLAISNTIVDRVLEAPAKDWDLFLRGVVRKEEAAAREKQQAWLAKRDPAARPSRPLTEYTGRYSEPAYDTAQVVLEDGKLLWKWSAFSAPLVHDEHETFVIQEPMLGYPRLVFQLDAEGRPSGMEVAHPLSVTFRRVR
jgi:CubicO group peptidase (beta-lactamase class C family)